MSVPHILVVDDEPDIRDLLREILEDEGYEVSTAESARHAREARRQRRPDLVLLDIWMPDVDGITLLKEWREGERLPWPVIMMSGHGTVETAVEATRLGAYDYIEKPLSLAKLLLTVKHAMDEDQLQRENLGLRRAQLWQEPSGSSQAIRQARDQAWRIAQHNAWVLITGEPGSGKESFARYIHTKSARRGRPFVVMGAARMGREEPSIELFGAESAGDLRYGLLEQANGGILFVDEVAELDAAVQAKLLSALESQRFLRVGGSEPVQVDVRVIAASRENLEQSVADGQLREDLYYHLNVVPLHVPPLRDRLEDVSELLEQAINWYVDHEGLPYRHFSVAAQNRLRNYSWPGNLRELNNLVQRMLILTSSEEIGVEEVEAALGSSAPPITTSATPQIDLDLPLRQARERFERAYLQRQLRECGGSVGELAKRAGMERTHLYRKLRALGVDPKQLK